MKSELLKQIEKKIDKILKIIKFGHFFLKKRRKNLGRNSGTGKVRYTINMKNIQLKMKTYKL